ncbi:type I-C CRISPR-associated protein Cas7/Csd2 [Salipiger sp. P9]|uniref:type I-C CRISPR-associated protein Cas7/Csd2 n=1 Tax=Salipiger pentaromativorans TaxID=2943193 RepID=UPI002157BBEE|nr:type I-C CRISPR-associated protein Cas7/Csd2 [Salipiger pentaromativorans]MCR8547611.1 type I-C CRISPR-associated protein Cas7/Csd2 [Salipiger pentaromativorans]
MTALTNRYDFALFFTVKDGNPNGDPDAGNLPRMDPETNNGLVTDVALKRKVRNYIAMAKGDEPGFGIYFTERAVLNTLHKKAYDALELKPESKKLPKKAEEAAQITGWMCRNFFDIRTFGAVMTTEVNAGQVRGPVQLSFARSVEPVMPLEVSITRSSVTNEKDVDKERTMGRKHIVPFGLYVVHGFINAKLAEKTGFSEEDLALFWTALRDMFDFDRSAARGEMAAQELVMFKHDSALGNAQAHRLFERIAVLRKRGDEVLPAGDERTHNWPPARAYSDYDIRVDDSALPSGVTLLRPWSGAA